MHIFSLKVILQQDQWPWCFTNLIIKAFTHLPPPLDKGRQAKSNGAILLKKETLIDICSSAQTKDLFSLDVIQALSALKPTRE